MSYIPQDTSFWETRTRNHKHMDWLYASKDWIDGYEKSIDHPHRQVVLAFLRTLSPFGSLLEIGCSVGPNLKLIQKAFPEVKLAGIDPNEASVEAAHAFVPGSGVILGDARHLPFEMKSFDVVLCDASLMYIAPQEIQHVMDDIALIAKKAIVIVDRCTQSKLGSLAGGVWGRDYETLLKERGFTVEKRPITKEEWPGSSNWHKFGQYIIGERI